MLSRSLAIFALQCIVLVNAWGAGPSPQEIAIADVESVDRLVIIGVQHLHLGEQGGDDAQQNYDLARDALEKALSITPDLPAASHALASVYMRIGKTELAVEVLVQGISATPDSTDLHSKLGYAFRYAGLLDRSIEEYRLSQRFDSTHENLIRTQRQIIKALIYSARFEMAFDAYAIMLESLRQLGRGPDEKMQFYQGLAYYYAGDIDAAVAMFEGSRRTDPGTLWSQFAAAYQSAATGQVTELRQFADDLESGNVSDGERRYRLAHLNALADRPGKALAHLEASAHSGFFCLPFTQNDGLLANIMRTKDFARILEYIRLRHLAFVEDLDRRNTDSQETP